MLKISIPRSYPSWDSRVDKYLWCLQKQNPFATFFKTNAYLWNYPDFVKVISAFRDVFGLGSFTFKEIDKFLWSEGAALAVSRLRTDQIA
jgi:hypothetical protein